MPPLRFLVAATVTLASPAHAQLYADFNTSLGDFSVTLFFADAPRTVANFVTLAEGTRPWWDESVLRLQTGVRFYDGQIFHRVIPGSFIQAGSRKRDGSDRPGFVIPDELRKNPVTGALLHAHSGPGVLSMAKRTAPHSGGGQFFVTLSPQSHLDDLHTVFGALAAGPAGSPTIEQGLAVVTAIASAPRDPADKPLADITINQVTIRRSGPEAEAFDPLAWQLPVVRGPAPIEISYTPPAGSTPAKLQLGLDVPVFRSYEYLHSVDLLSWKRVFGTAIFDAPIPDAVLDATPESQGRTTGFFQLLETDFSELIGRTLVPLSNTATIQLRFTAPFVAEITAARSPAGTGTWSTPGPPARTGPLAFSSYGGGPGDAGLFSPEMTLVFTGFAGPLVGGQELTNLIPTLTFNARSMTEGYFTATGATFEGGSIAGRGVFTILTP